jgi:hypothetical protein
MKAPIGPNVLAPEKGSSTQPRVAGKAAPVVEDIDVDTNVRRNLRRSTTGSRHVPKERVSTMETGKEKVSDNNMTMSL